MNDDKFGRSCPVCAKRFEPTFLRRHVGLKHPTFDLKLLKEVGK
jgi:uncharacterized protein (UPF0212 family)